VMRDTNTRAIHSESNLFPSACCTSTQYFNSLLSVRAWITGSQVQRQSVALQDSGTLLESVEQTARHEIRSYEALAIERGSFLLGTRPDLGTCDGPLRGG
jgi:hypothetical protein